MQKKKELYVVCYNVRSLFNVGSIFRTADAVGASKIFLCGITPTPEEGRGLKSINKVALGAEKYLEWEKRIKTKLLLKRLKKEGFYIVGIEQAKNAVSLFEFRRPYKEKIALIVGNEVRGIPFNILSCCDAVVDIPMLGKKESLNVAVAFGVAAYALSPLIPLRRSWRRLE